MTTSTGSNTSTCRLSPVSVIPDDAPSESGTFRLVYEADCGQAGAFGILGGCFGVTSMEVRVFTMLKEYFDMLKECGVFLPCSRFHVNIFQVYEKWEMAIFNHT